MISILSLTPQVPQKSTLFSLERHIGQYLSILITFFIIIINYNFYTYKLAGLLFNKILLLIITFIWGKVLLLLSEVKGE
jgi:hypothetical protein